MNALAPWQDDRDETTLKTAFAAALLRTPNDPFEAAKAVFGTNTVRALMVARDWVSDMFVLKTQAKLIEQFGEENFLPSKVTLARRVFELGSSNNATINERLACYRLYADLRGFIEKQTAIANVTVNNNKVMVVTDHGDDSEWERKTREQQAKLVEHSRD